jgi:hypothetical protein
VWIEDSVEPVDMGIADKKLSEYFVAFLDTKDVKNIPEMVNHIHPEIKIKHSISLFILIVKKIQERY